MRRLFAWAISFSLQDQIVNRAVHELSEIARQKVGLNASMLHAQQWHGYQQARLRRYVRDYLAKLQRGERPMNPIRREQLTEAILKRLSGQLWSAQHAPVLVEVSSRKAA